MAAKTRDLMREHALKCFKGSDSNEAIGRGRFRRMFQVGLFSQISVANFFESEDFKKVPTISTY
jgi:hypothetical protein